MADTIKLFGGPGHGRYERFDSPRLMVVIPPLELPRYFGPLEMIDRPLFQTVSYYRQDYSEQQARPRRSKTISVGILEGAQLHPHEERELRHEIRKQPWKFPEVNILTEFDEWFAQAVFRHTGELRWKCERVCDY